MKKRTTVALVLLAVIASILTTQNVFAQSNVATSSIGLSDLNVQLTYPSHVLPGQSISINLTAQAKDSFELTSLTMQVYLADQNNLRQLVSTTVAQNTFMLGGDQLNKQIQVTVPSDAPRTSLVAQVTESTGVSYNANGGYAYPYWNNNWYAGGYAYPYWNNNWYGAYPYYYYNYGYAPAYSVGSYPSYSPPVGSDYGIAPLSYVIATTPEDVALQSQNQQLQTQNQQLQQQLQSLQNSTAQKDNTITNLNNQLSSLQSTSTLVEIVAAVLAIAVVAVAALHFKTTRTTQTKSTSTSTA